MYSLQNTFSLTHFHQQTSHQISTITQHQSPHLQSATVFITQDGRRRASFSQTSVCILTSLTHFSSKYLILSRSMKISYSLRTSNLANRIAQRAMRFGSSRAILHLVIYHFSFSPHLHTCFLSSYCQPRSPAFSPAFARCRQWTSFS